MKKRTIALVALVLAVVLTGFSVSGTYAKYTTAFESETDTAKIAVWDIKFNDESKTTADKTFTFNLFDEDTNKVVATKDNGDLIIAPGSKGSAKFKVTNASDVDATLKITFESSHSDLLSYTIKKGESADQTVGEPTKNLASFSDLNSVELAKGASETYTIEWEWKYYESSDEDEADTTLGEASETSSRTAVTVQAKVEATQKAVG